MSFMKGAVSALAVALVLAGGRVAQAAQFNVTVGGTSGLKFEPEFVVSVPPNGDPVYDVNMLVFRMQ